MWQMSWLKLFKCTSCFLVCLQLAAIKLSRYGEDLLFYLYYMNGGDLLQLLAAVELWEQHTNTHTHTHTHTQLLLHKLIQVKIFYRPVHSDYQLLVLHWVLLSHWWAIINVCVCVCVCVCVSRFNRDWRYHKEERVWITRAPGMEPTLKTNAYERGTYYFFDCLNWRKVAKVNTHTHTHTHTHTAVSYLFLI